MESIICACESLPTFFIFFLAIYLLAYLKVFKNWDPILRPEASSCLISYAHGTPAAVLASLAIFTHPQRGFAAQNTDFQNLVLDYSSAYFLTDLCHYLYFNPSDVLFIGHHLATLFVFLTCRYIVYHGAFAILGLLVLAEVTSFCQNTWTLASVRRKDVVFAARLYDAMSPMFYAFYSIVRGFVGPAFVYRMGVFYLSGKADHVIPRWISVSWIVVVVGAISVSILWIANLWIDLYREKKQVIKKKKAT